MRRKLHRLEAWSYQYQFTGGRFDRARESRARESIRQTKTKGAGRVFLSVLPLLGVVVDAKMRPAGSFFALLSSLLQDRFPSQQRRRTLSGARAGYGRRRRFAFAPLVTRAPKLRKPASHPARSVRTRPSWMQGEVNVVRTGGWRTSSGLSRKPLPRSFRRKPESIVRQAGYRRAAPGSVLGTGSRPAPG